MSLTSDVLNELFNYDPETGSLTRAVRRRGCVQGAEVGHVFEDTCTKYRRTQLNGKHYLLIWIMVNGHIPANKVIDHKDGDGLNNRLDNLRCVSVAGNSRNRRRNNRSKFAATGITLVNGRYRVTGHKDGKAVALGTYHTERDAYLAKKHWEVKNGYTLRHGMKDS